MSIENAQVIIIKNEKQRESVVNFMLENNISFQAGFDTSYEVMELAEELAYESSNEQWNSSGCEYS